MKKSVLATRIILIGVVGVIILQFVNLTLPIIFGQNLNSIAYGTSLPIKNPDNFVVILNLVDNSNGDINIELVSILTPGKDNTNDNPICIKKLFIENINAPRPENNKIFDFDSPWAFIPQGLTALSFYTVSPYEITFNDLCAGNYPNEINSFELKNFIANSETPLITITPNAEQSIFYFPLDKRNIELYIWAESSGGFMEPDVVTIISSTDWDANLTKTSDSFAFFIGTDPFGSLIDSPDKDEHVNVIGGITDYADIMVNYWRPTTTRVLVFTLLFMLLAIIVVSTFIKDSGSYFGVFLGVLLGLSGLLPILKPANAPEKTMIDAVFLSYYVLLGITVKD